MHHVNHIRVEIPRQPKTHRTEIRSVKQGSMKENGDQQIQSLQKDRKEGKEGRRKPEYRNLNSKP